jgi:hypothetical protein
MQKEIESRYEQQVTIRAWVSIAEDAINTAMEKIEEYKQEFGEHGELIPRLHEKLEDALGPIEDAKTEAGLLEGRTD